MKINVRDFLRLENSIIFIKKIEYANIVYTQIVDGNNHYITVDGLVPFQLNYLERVCKPLLPQEIEMYKLETL